MIFPSIWFLSPSGLMTRPQSCESANRIGAIGDRDAAAGCFCSRRTGGGGWPFLPASLLHYRHQCVYAALILAEIAHSELNRIDSLICGDLIDERFARETARDVARGAQITCAKRRLIGLHPGDQWRGALLIFKGVHLAAALGAVGISIGARLHADLPRGEQA